jgi:hypothetical protein
MLKALSGLVLAACVLATVPAHAAFSKATPNGKADLTCASGSFSDPRNGGECWSCPSGYGRTVLYPVTSDKACEKPANVTYADADFQHSWGCDAGEGEFFDPRKGGECWKCPSNRPRRTAYSVTSDKACATKEVIGEKLASATFKHKFKGCSGRGFYDPRKGGQCWTCPKGYDRTADAVTSNHACSKRVSEDYDPATKTGSVCPAGAFADPNGGCYSCPKDRPYRSIYAVTSDRACASSIQDAFVPDAAGGQQLCMDVVAALDKAIKEGAKAKEQLMNVVKPFVEPVRKPLEEQVGKVAGRVASATKVGDVLDEVEAPVKPYVDDATAFAKNIADKKSELQSIMLDPKVVCGGDAKLILTKLKAVLTKVGTGYFAVAVTASFKHPTYAPRLVVGLSYTTDLDGKGGLAFDIGLSADVPLNPAVVTVALGGAYYPKRALDFGLSGVPELGISLAKGGAFDEAVDKFKALGVLSAVDSLDVAWDFDTAHIPGFGISKEIISVGPEGKSLFSASGTVSWSIPIVHYGG